MFSGPMVDVEIKKPHTSVMYVGKEENSTPAEDEEETDTCLPSQVPEERPPTAPVSTSGSPKGACRPPEEEEQEGGSD